MSKHGFAALFFVTVTDEATITSVALTTTI
jgi:hypothetical protein